jgi:hypothetical protein
LAWTIVPKQLPSRFKAGEQRYISLLAVIDSQPVCSPCLRYKPDWAHQV